MQSPIVSPVSVNGIQTIQVYDNDAKIRRNIVTTKEKADEFISTRNEKLKKAKNISNVITFASALGMIAIGGKGAFNYILNGFFGGIVGSVIGQNAIVSPVNNKETQKFIQENS